MSTIYTFHEECAEIGAALAADDEILVYDTSAGRTKSAAASRLNTLATGAATSTEVERNTDVSARMIAASGTLTLTEAAHEGKIIKLDTAAGSVVTLPASTGGGAVYKFLVTVTATSNSHVIKVANASDEMRGFIFVLSDDSANVIGFQAADNDDTITFNRTTTGTAAQGHLVEIVDAALNHWFVRGFTSASGTEATPFSATVS